MIVTSPAMVPTEPGLQAGFTFSRAFVALQYPDLIAVLARTNAMRVVFDCLVLSHAGSRSASEARSPCHGIGLANSRLREP